MSYDYITPRKCSGCGMLTDRCVCLTDETCANCGEGIRADEDVKTNKKGEPEHENCAW